MHIFARFFNNSLPFAAKRCYFAAKSSITLKETFPFVYPPCSVYTYMREKVYKF